MTNDDHYDELILLISEAIDGHVVEYPEGVIIIEVVQAALMEVTIKTFHHLTPARRKDLLESYLNRLRMCVEGIDAPTPGRKDLH
ncbi:hypothetical protein [Bradyrhizobium sp. S3.7.6]